MNRRTFFGAIGALVVSRFIPPAWYLDAIGPRRPDRIALAGAFDPFGEFCRLTTWRFSYTSSEANARLAWTYDEDATFDLVSWIEHVQYKP